MSIIENLVKDMTAVEIMAKLEEEGKKCCAGTKNLLVWYMIAGHIFELTCNYKPFIENNHALLEEELVRLRHKNADFQAAVDQINNKEADKERLIGIGEKLDKLKNIVQRPCILEVDKLYLHIRFVATRANPHNLVLLIPIAVAAFLFSVDIGQTKNPTNNVILRVVQNSTPSENIVNQIVRRTHQNCYKDVVINLESGMLMALAFYKGDRGGLGNFSK